MNVVQSESLNKTDRLRYRNDITMKRLFLLCTLLAFLMAGCTKDEGGTPPPQGPLPIQDGVLPVIFHVLYDDANDPKQNMDAALIHRRIEQLNRFYANTLFDTEQIHGIPNQTVPVQFVAATHDPDGNSLPEPGIDRVHYAGALNMDFEWFLNSDRELKPRDLSILWPTDRYVNIWLFQFRSSDDPALDQSLTTGASYTPFCTSAHPLSKLPMWNNAWYYQPNYMHGMALNSYYFNRETEHPLDDGGMLTLCHEMGHYLGLLHVFAYGDEEPGTDPADNASDDGCTDTPKYDRETYQEWLSSLDMSDPLQWGTAHYRIPSDGGEPFLSVNIMDYYMSYRTNITAQQKARIEHVLHYCPWIPRSEESNQVLMRQLSKAGRSSGERPRPILLR